MQFLYRTFGIKRPNRIEVRFCFQFIFWYLVSGVVYGIALPFLVPHTVSPSRSLCITLGLLSGGDPFSFKTDVFDPVPLPKQSLIPSTRVNPQATPKSPSPQPKSPPVQNRTSERSVVEADDHKLLVQLTHEIDLLKKDLRSKNTAEPDKQVEPDSAAAFAWTVAWLIHLASYLILPLSLAALFNVILLESQLRRQEDLSMGIRRSYRKLSRFDPTLYPSTPEAEESFVSATLKEKYD